MSKVRNKNTSLELLLRRALWSQGLRYLTPQGWVAKYGAGLFGKPDLIFPRARVVVFVDGCYWHGCPQECKGTPKTNPEFWTAKIEKNIRRDLDVKQQLTEAGWIVLRFWEHQLKRKAGLAEAVREILNIVRGTTGPNPGT